MPRKTRKAKRLRAFLGSEGISECPHPKKSFILVFAGFGVVKMENEINVGDIVISPEGKKGRVVCVYPHALEVQWFADMNTEIIRDASRYEIIPAGEHLIDLLESMFHIPARSMITQANFRYAVEASIPNDELWAYSAYNPAFVEGVEHTNTPNNINRRFHIVNQIMHDIQCLKRAKKK